MNGVLGSRYRLSRATPQASQTGLTPFGIDVVGNEGWVRRFVAEEPRLSEAVELYLSLGMEVHLEPLELDELQEEGQCTECLRGSRDRMRVIYTRCLSREGEIEGARDKKG